MNASRFLSLLIVGLTLAACSRGPTLPTDAQAYAAITAALADDARRDRTAAPDLSAVHVESCKPSSTGGPGLLCSLAGTAPGSAPFQFRAVIWPTPTAAAPFRAFLIPGDHS